MEHQSNASDVARLLSQIEVEYLAAHRGLTGLAESAKHAAITARMENLGKLHEHLRTIVGEDATRVMAEHLEYLSFAERGQIDTHTAGSEEVGKWEH